MAGEGALTVKDVFAARIAPRLKTLQFKKERHTWRRFEDKIVRVVNLQNSSFSSEFYVNFGVLFVGANKPVKPLEYQCDARSRFAGLVPVEYQNAAQFGPEISSLPLGYHLTESDADGIELILSKQDELLFTHAIPRLLGFPHHQNDKVDWWGTINPTP